MIWLLVVSLLQVQGIPTSPTSNATALSPSSTISETCSSDDPGRNIWGIIWSCLVTIFTCTWVAVHPDVPNPKEKRQSKWRAFRLRLLITFLAIIAPESVVYTAAREWQHARKIARRWQVKGWTMTHGFFLEMGGFVLYENGKPSSVLSRKDFKLLVTGGFIDFPQATADEIEDKSKGDWLSKALVVLQTSWFIVQCIARLASGLFVTELELFTLAFASLNGLIYFFWWKKPVDIQCPIPVHMKLQHRRSREEETSFFTLSQAAHHRRDTSERFEPELQRPTRVMTFGTYGEATLPSKLEWSGSSLPEAEDAALTMVQTQVLGGSSFWKPQPYSLINLRRPSSFAGVKDSYKVPIGVVAVATLFGAIHCVAWSFLFPSIVEKLMWRTASLIIICEPFLLLTTFTSFGPCDIFLIFLLGLYIAARLVLLTLAFTSLRSLPAGAYQDVQWTDFIPHL
ncbi:hypothetical protein M422DRAFT_223053 [Sphaerobolus stellatus SS14]|nr:hypothetical protein M422DRAFT_223053 [Sphaerobolus stellatus SS14]